MTIAPPNPLANGFYPYWDRIKADRLRGKPAIDHADIEDAEYDRFVESNRRRLALRKREAEASARLAAQRREMIADRLRAEGRIAGSPSLAWYGVKLPRYAVVWDTPTDSEVVIENVPYREAVARHALDSFLRSDSDVRLTIDHDYSRVIARRCNGTLQLAADATGVRMAFALPFDGGTSAQQEARERLAAGQLRSASWTPDVPKSKYEIRTVRGVTCAVVTSMQLVECCLTDSPAYSETRV
ncbi:MAG: HK97 family phage prohead protease [Planctomycetaceae bacterium]|nr:HK97 family phage prohead protease [Planctomycetaceae bacterium]